MDCPYCSFPHMEWRMDEVVSKGRIWDTNLGLWHDCKESPDAKRKKQNEEFKKEREAILLEERKRKVGKLKTPIYCHLCAKAHKPNNPCDHMIQDGFEIGVDGGDFYADTFKANERRKYLKDKLKKGELKRKPSKKGLDGFV